MMGKHSILTLSSQVLRMHKKLKKKLRFHEKILFSHTHCEISQFFINEKSVKLTFSHTQKILYLLWQKFRESNVFTKEFTTVLFWRIIFLARLIFWFSHAASALCCALHCDQETFVLVDFTKYFLIENWWIFVDPQENTDLVLFLL